MNTARHNAPRLAADRKRTAPNPNAQAGTAMNSPIAIHEETAVTSSALFGMARMLRVCRSKAAAELGRMGGKARAKKLGKEQRSEIARNAAKSRWADHKRSSSSSSTSRLGCVADAAALVVAQVEDDPGAFLLDAGQGVFELLTEHHNTESHCNR
jgi:hypothetical protein